MFKDGDKNKVNEVLSLSSKILRITYIVGLILGVYVITLILREWGILGFLLNILKILSPLFIGLLIAWLLDPLVKYLTKKGMRRVLATIIAYLSFLTVIYIIVSAMVPMLGSQIDEFVTTLPNIINTIKEWIDGVFSNLSSTSTYDFNATKLELFDSMETIRVNLTTDLPEMIVTFAKALFSAVGVILVGIIIGFYMLFDFDGVSNKLITFLPKKWRKNGQELLIEVNTSLRKFVQGTLIISGIIFVATSIAFWILGLEAPLLFGLICGVTNIIPYIGPFIGGAPAAIVGFTQGTSTGILIIVAIFIIQFIEGNILQPFIMGKTMRLHPVTIMIGLLIFGSLFGILGLILATPLIAIGKIIIVFIDKRYDILKWTRHKK